VIIFNIRKNYQKNQKKYDTLKYLVILHKNITKIINFPISIIEITCSFNKLSKLNNLQKIIIKLGCYIIIKSIS